MDEIKDTGLVATLASNLNLTKEQLVATVQNTVFKKATNSQLMVFFGVCQELRFNPLLKMAWAYPDKEGGVQVLISYSGWIHIANNHPQFDGEETTVAFDPQTDRPISATCVIWRKDRTHPTIVTVYFKEWYKPTNPNWNERPAHMLSIRAYIQAVRKAFGLNQYDYDADNPEWRNTIDVTPPTAQETKTSLTDLVKEEKTGPVKEPDPVTLKSDDLDVVEPIPEKKEPKPRKPRVTPTAKPEDIYPPEELSNVVENESKEQQDNYVELLKEVSGLYSERKDCQGFPATEKELLDKILLNGEFIEEYCNVEKLESIKKWLLDNFMAVKPNEPVQASSISEAVETNDADAEAEAFAAMWEKK